jgi:hypothetical protein
MTLGELPPMIADDAQAKRHGAPNQMAFAAKNPSRLHGRGSFPGHVRQRNAHAKLAAALNGAVAASHIFGIMFVNRAEIYARRHYST